MADSSLVRLEGRFMHVIYSPRGEIEGILLRANGTPVQIIVDRHHPSALRLQVLREGQLITIGVVPAEPSPGGAAPHPVFDLCELIAVDGSAPAGPPPQEAHVQAAFRGHVERFNYARHGAINGVVLDTGDFLHFKPEGYARLALNLGDWVEADGHAQQLVDGRGWAVDITEVNGLPLSMPVSKD